MRIHKRLIRSFLTLLALGCSSTSALASPTEDRAPDAATVLPMPPDAVDHVRFVRASVPLAEEVEAMFRAADAAKRESASELGADPPASPAAGPEDPAGPAFALLYWTILGLHPEWRPEACDRPFAGAGSKVVCERTRDRGQGWAGRLSLYVFTEAVRQGICRPSDALCFLWFAGQGERESGLTQGDICRLVLPAAWVEEIPVDARLNERVRMCWHRGNGGRNCQKVYLRARSDREYVVDRCAYGEVGVFQIRSHEARSGQIVPATGEQLPASWTTRRELLLDPWRNISLAFEAFRVGRDWCCGEDQVCLSRVNFWLGVYNSGKCRGRQTVRYVDKIGRAIVKAMKYVCLALPAVDLGGFDVCDQGDVSDYFTPPGHSRRRAASRDAP